MQGWIQDRARNFWSHAHFQVDHTHFDQRPHVLSLLLCLSAGSRLKNTRRWATVRVFFLFAIKSIITRLILEAWAKRGVSRNLRISLDSPLSDGLEPTPSLCKLPPLCVECDPRYSKHLLCHLSKGNPIICHVVCLQASRSSVHNALDSGCRKSCKTFNAGTKMMLGRGGLLLWISIERQHHFDHLH